jgi:hypothetical protein
VEKSGAPRPGPELVLNWAAAQYEIALKGHDFSRAKKNRMMCPGLAPEARFPSLTIPAQTLAYA